MGVKKQSWQNIDFSKLPQDDSLLACLVVLCRYHQHPASAKSLSARLPLQGHKLTLELFPRAAERAGLQAEIAEHDIDALSSDLLPAVVLDSDGQAYVLFENQENERQIINPVGETQFLPLSAVQDKLQPTILLINPTYQFTERANETLQKEKRHWFWPVMLKGLPIFSEVLIASFLISLFAIVMPLFVMNVYDRVVPNHAIETLWVLASGIFIVFSFDFLLKSLRAYFIDSANKRTDTELSSLIFSHVMGIRMSERPKSVGSLANIMQSYELFRDFITSSTITVLIDIPFIFIFVLVIKWIGGPIFWVPLTVIPLVLIVGLLLQIPLIRLTKNSYKLAAEKQAILFESLHNIETVKTTSAESGLQAKWEEVVYLININGSKIKNWSSFSSNFSVLVQQLATVAVVIWGVYLISNNELTLGALIACSILTGRAIAPMTQISNLFTRYYQATNALHGIDKLMQLNTDTSNERAYLHRPRLNGYIRFKNVHFSYTDDQTPILQNLNFDIKSGEKVAVIGRIGSGKSTLARLLLRLYEPSSGGILYDETDYRQINPDDIREQVGYVCQDVSLFYGSVRDNITVAAPFVDDQRLIDVCNTAGIGNFTNKHPMGIDRPVGERGLELSGGQRQCVAIARALLLDPKIIILDEPSSAMDDNSEKRLKISLKSYLDDSHTLLLITHKFSMLELVDRIIVLEEGRVVADGPKDSVISALKMGIHMSEKEEKSSEKP